MSVERPSDPNFSWPWWRVELELMWPANEKKDKRHDKGKRGGMDTSEASNSEEDSEYVVSDSDSEYLVSDSGSDWAFGDNSDGDDQEPSGKRAQRVPASLLVRKEFFESMALAAASTDGEVPGTPDTREAFDALVKTAFRIQADAITRKQERFLRRRESMSNERDPWSLIATMGPARGEGQALPEQREPRGEEYGGEGVEWVPEAGADELLCRQARQQALEALANTAAAAKMTRKSRESRERFHRRRREVQEGGATRTLSAANMRGETKLLARLERMQRAEEIMRV